MEGGGRPGKLDPPGRRSRPKPAGGPTRFSGGQSAGAGRLAGGNSRTPAASLQRRGWGQGAGDGLGRVSSRLGTGPRALSFGPAQASFGDRDMKTGSNIPMR